MSTQPSLPARHWVTHAFGDLSSLRLEHITVPPPAPHEIRLRVRAIGLNFADVFAVLGLYDASGHPPFTPGFEACGIVDAVGQAVTTFRPGDRAFCLSRFGAYTTALNVSAALTRPLPTDWTFADGAAFPAQAFTAWYSLRVLGGLPRKGEVPLQVTSNRMSVLVHSAAGGVGLRLVEMVTRLGGLPVCTVGSLEKVAVLRDRLGVPRERVVVRGLDDVGRGGFERVLRERALGNEGGLDVVVDSVLGSYFQGGYDLLNLGGRYVVMGAASLMPTGGIGLLRPSSWQNLVRLAWGFLTRPRLDLVGMINENRTVVGFNASSLFGEIRLMEKGFEEIEEMGLDKALVGRTFPFEEAVDGLKFFQSGKSVGKLVLVVCEDEDHV